MIKKRYFKNSKDYFKFLDNKNKFINVISVSIKKKSIRVDYENKSPEEIDAEEIELNFESEVKGYVW